MLRSLWLYRHFMLSSIRGELQGRFVRSYLGGFWFVLHPMAQSLIFSIVLAEVMRARIPNMDSTVAYPIYLLSGMAAWSLFSEILNRSMTVFIEHATVLKKIAFPRLCLPIIVWGGAIINHLLLLLAIAVIFLFFGHYPGWAWLSLPIGIALISALAFGLGVLLGVINVFARDVAQVMVVVMQLWFWFTPIVYVKSVLPESIRLNINLNPMTSLVGIYQDALLLNKAPNFVDIMPSAVLAAVAVMAAFIIFRRASLELVDAL